MHFCANRSVQNVVAISLAISFQGFHFLSLAIVYESKTPHISATYHILASNCSAILVLLQSMMKKKKNSLKKKKKKN